MNPALAIFEAGLAAVDPGRAVLSALRIDGDILQVAGARYDLAAFDEIIVLGAGKATARMALALEELLGARITAGLIVVKHRHGVALRHIEQVEAAHPVPDAAGVAATQRILAMAAQAGQRSLVLALLSGGASALLVAPAAHITLQDKQETTRLLLNAGADIGELNTVRKHLSDIKGGRLAQAVYPAQLLTLILSDVIGDPMAVIASGPTAPDASSYDDAWQVLERHGLLRSLPESVAAHLRAGCAGLQAETVRHDAPCWQTTRNVLVANLQLALQAACSRAQQMGYRSRIVTATLQGEARVAARQLAQIARQEFVQMQTGERRCLLSGGETTVQVRGSGLGGRNQELALSFAIAVSAMPGVTLLSAGTDGSDGPTDAAGALVDGHTLACGADLDAQAYLDNNDSYHYFQRVDALHADRAHLKTGPTGSNVMDMQIMLLHR